MKKGQLISHSLFDDLTDRELSLLLDHCGSLVIFEVGETVLRQGEVDDSNLFIIMVGKVKVLMEAGAEETVVLSELKNGDMFGEFALFTREARSASVITEEYTEVLKIDMGRLDEMFTVDAGTAFKLVKYIAKESARKLYQRVKK